MSEFVRLRMSRIMAEIEVERPHVCGEGPLLSRINANRSRRQWSKWLATGEWTR